MKILLKLGLFCSLLFVVSSGSASAQYGLICGDPLEAGCQPQYDGFKPYDLAFQTYRAELGTGTRHQSDEFYGVILASVKAAASNSQGCSFINEVRRAAAQKLFPHHKVFASRNSCRGSVVYYEGTNNDFNFLAVYGGKTQAEAQQVLQTAKKKYPQANIRRMRVILDFADD